MDGKLFLSIIMIVLSVISITLQIFAWINLGRDISRAKEFLIASSICNLELAIFYISYWFI